MVSGGAPTVRARALIPLLPSLILAALAVGAACAIGGARAPAPLALLGCAALGAALGAVLLGLARLARRGPGAGRALLAGAAAALGGLGALLLPAPGPAVMIVVIDCLRDDRLDAERSPNLAALAETAWRFRTTRAASSWTRSAVPSLLSSRWPVEHGMLRVRPVPDRLAEDVRLISEELRDAGWRTAAFATQGQLDRAFGMGRGYDRYGTEDGKTGGIVRRFLAWHLLHRAEPRFVYLHTVDVHMPYRPGPAFRPNELPESELRLGAAVGWRASLARVRRGEHALDDADRAFAAALYDAEVRQVDHALGRLFRRLEADGSLDRTWLVITSDHGELLGEHDALSHGGTPWEVLLRVPLLIRPPGGLAEGVEIATPAHHVDVLPTLLEAVGLPAPDGIAGRSLLPLTRGEPLEPAPAYADYAGRDLRRLAVILEDWKLIREGSRNKLFSLASDPGELQDLAAAHPERAQALGALLDAYLARGLGRETGPAPEVSEETMRALEELGYLD